MLNGKVVLITGTTSGFGNAMARDFKKAGARVIGVGRRVDRLKKMEEELQGGEGSFWGYEGDITQEGLSKKLVQDVIDKYGHLDILINNAAIMMHRPVLEGRMSEYSTMLDLNVKAVMSLTMEALPHIIEASEKNADKVADIIMISSVAAFRPEGNKGGYACSKAALSAWAESLRVEMLPTHVRVSTLEPGAGETEICSHVTHDAERLAGIRVRQTYKCLQPEDISRLCVFMCETPRHCELSRVVIRPTLQY